MLIEKQRGAMRLVGCDAAALAQGLKPGMSLSEARAVVPLVHAADMDRGADRAALLKLLEFCERFTPMVALDGENGLLLDVTGCTHLFGGEIAMLRQVEAKLTAKRLTLRQAMAGTPDCAHLLARFSKLTHVLPGKEREAVVGLGIAALEMPREITTPLARAGLKTIGDLVERPSQLLTARFGAGLATKIKRVTGQEDMRITPMRAPPELTAEQNFAEPLLHVDQLMVAIATLITRICVLLEKRGAGGREFELCVFRSDGLVRRVGVETAAPLRAADDLRKLFALRLETLSDPLDPGFGFDALRLNVIRSEAFVQGQRQLDGKLDESGSEAALIDRLIIRFGASQVLRFVARDSHDPLRAAAAVPVAAHVVSAQWQQNLPRPLQLFSPPQPIEVMAEVPDGPPIRFRWRKVLHEVKAAEGPERIESEWWRDGAAPPRDYYRVEDKHGARFWVFREGLFTSINPPPRWFMHGLFA